MDRLQRLRVRGFRSLRDVDLELGALTVLIGANGSGKSNLIECFRLLESLMSGGLQRYVANSGAGSILHYGSKRTPVLELELSFAGEAGGSEYRASLRFEAPDRLVFAEETLRIVDVGTGAIVKSSASGHAESFLPMLAASKQDLATVGQAGELVRRFRGRQPYTFHDMSGSGPRRGGESFDAPHVLAGDGSNLAMFLAFLRASYPAHFECILSNARLVLPYLRELDVVPAVSKTRKAQLRWRDRASDGEFTWRELSDGSLRAIAVITALLQPAELMPAMILLDGPDIGLHPHVLGQVAGLVQAASMKTQVVVATQSPSLLRRFEPRDALAVEREEDAEGRGASTFHRLSAERLGRWTEERDLGVLYEMSVTGGAPQ